MTCSFEKDNRWHCNCRALSFCLFTIRRRRHRNWKKQMADRRAGREINIC